MHFSHFHACLFKTPEAISYVLDRFFIVENRKIYFRNFIIIFRNNYYTLNKFPELVKFDAKRNYDSHSLPRLRKTGFTQDNARIFALELTLRMCLVDRQFSPNFIVACLLMCELAKRPFEFQKIGMCSDRSEFQSTVDFYHNVSGCLKFSENINNFTGRERDDRWVKTYWLFPDNRLFEGCSK